LQIVWIWMIRPGTPAVVVAAAVGLSSTGDGYNNRQGATFARAES